MRFMLCVWVFFCEWFECTCSNHAFKVVRIVVIRLYIGWFECTYSRCALLRVCTYGCHSPVCPSWKPDFRCNLS